MAVWVPQENRPLVCRHRPHTAWNATCVPRIQEVLTVIFPQVSFVIKCCCPESLIPPAPHFCPRGAPSSRGVSQLLTEARPWGNTIQGHLCAP